MKRIITLLMLFVAVTGNVMAYEPVIKERHWFGVHEDMGDSPYHFDITWEGTYIKSIQGYKEWDGVSDHHRPQSTFYSWLDHRLRFSVNVTSNWEVKKNNSSSYAGIGLFNKQTNTNGTNFWIHDLKAGDQFNIEYYREPNTSRVPFLVSGSVEGKTPGNEQSGDNAIYGADANGLVFYTCTSDGDVQVNIPGQTVIRSVTIIHKEYKKATYETKQITDNGNIGYETTLTGSGVLEDKRGAVPYITMRYGAEGDMTIVKDLGNAYGAERFGASCIVDASHDFNPESGKLQKAYRDKGEAWTRQFLSGKEWSVFTADVDSNDDIFDSIYPLYGSYYYFFPEVDGKLTMRFYCEGTNETMAFWYKQRADGSFPGIYDQPQVTQTGTNNSNTNGSYYYQYDVNVEKGGVYYLCSLPTNIAHEHPVIHLLSYSFVPAFRLDPLWYVATDAEKASGTITHAAELNQDFTVGGNWTMTWRCEGNIKSAEPYFEGTVLKFRNIVYKSQDDPTLNDGGSVIVDVSCTSGKATFVLTVPYSAEKAVATSDSQGHLQRVRDTDATRNPDGKEVKKWDFFSNVYAVGQYKDSNSQLYKEIHKADGLTADWVQTYMNVVEQHEPIFKSVYDMEGDNADMLKETEGLLIFADANQVAIYNENDPSISEFRDRYIGLLGGGELWVPGLHEGDRIVVKMGRWGNSATGQDAHIEIEGATDAIGTAITGDYVLGGSHVQDGDGQDKSIPYGEYHFISTGGHFKIKVTDAPLVKFYSIVIYRNAINDNHDIITENDILGTNREILYTDRDGGVTKEMKINLHVYGLGERSKDLTNMVSAYRTGRFMNTAPNFATTDNIYFTYTPAHELFGSFRARLGVTTKDAANAYVTDYADFSMAVGYRETKTYPYTWDFTDLKHYVVDYFEYLDADGTENAVNIKDLRVWQDKGMRVRAEECDNGTLFVNGGQLYAGTNFFVETRGIGIHHFNNDKRHNGGMTIQHDENGENGGLAVNDRNASADKPVFYGFIVPEVAAGQAIYVRARKVEGAKTSQAKYAVGDFKTEQAFTYTATIDGDEVFAMAKAAGDATGDVKLCFQGYEVKKIAVSTDPKQLSDNGWATESRNRVIDPELTAYMTGKPIVSLVVTAVNLGGKVVSLQEMGDTDLMPLSEGGDHHAYIIHHTEETAVNILNGGFHLFVPDIHDYLAGNESYCKKKLFTMPETMKARLTVGTVARDENGMRNFVLSNVIYPMDAEGNIKGSGRIGAEGFYQVKKGGINSNGNQGYLPVDIGLGGNAAVYNLMFVGDDETTGLETVLYTTPTDTEHAVYYNLNGQKMNGVPTQRGIYIVNGKKVIIR